MGQSNVGSFLLIPWTQIALKFRSSSHQLPVGNTYAKAIQSVLITKKETPYYSMTLAIIKLQHCSGHIYISYLV